MLSPTSFNLKWLLVNTLPSLGLLVAFASLQLPPDVLLLVVDVFLIGVGLGIGQALVLRPLQGNWRWGFFTSGGFTAGVVGGGLMGMVATFFYILLLGLIFNVILGMDDYTGDTEELDLLMQIIFVLPIPTLVGAFGGGIMGMAQAFSLRKVVTAVNTDRWVIQSLAAGAIAGALIGSLIVIMIRLNPPQPGLYFAVLTPLFTGIPLALFTAKQAAQLLQPGVEE